MEEVADEEEAPLPQPGDGYVNFCKSGLEIRLGVVIVQPPTPYPL